MSGTLQPRVLTAGGWQPVELHPGVSRFGPDLVLREGTYRMHPDIFAAREAVGLTRRVLVLPTIVDPAVEDFDGIADLIGAERLAA